MLRHFSREDRGSLIFDPLDIVWGVIERVNLVMDNRDRCPQTAKGKGGTNPFENLVFHRAHNAICSALCW